MIHKKYKVLFLEIKKYTHIIKFVVCYSQLGRLQNTYLNFVNHSYNTTSPYENRSWLSVRLWIEGLLVGDSPSVESLCCVLEQDTLSAA